mmetsp:Transcript_18659/g.21439  ORF Transcript_18659/g.21439 Transcript_18659/m.21439 type:complete len:96 (+) Transcript_18659:189-476(+)
MKAVKNMRRHLMCSPQAGIRLQKKFRFHSPVPRAHQLDTSSRESRTSVIPDKFNIHAVRKQAIQELSEGFNAEQKKINIFKMGTDLFQRRYSKVK